jgi:STE24 endopeptidase
MKIENKATPIERQRLFHWFFLLVLAVVLLSPLAYWLTGIGQSAAGLSAEVTRGPDGMLVSSPKAEALHRLSLPMRVERLFIYPLLLITFQLSGGALALRRWLEGRISGQGSGQARPAGAPEGAPSGEGLFLRWGARVIGWLGRPIPRAWRERVSGRDLMVILLFVLVLEAALALLYLPLNFYSGFTLAHQFGLSTQAAVGWVSDWVKNLILALVISGLLWTGFYVLMRLMPRRWPVPAGALMILVSAGLVLITPVVITPLFYEVCKLDTPELRTRILTLADRAGVQVDEVYVVNASTKTTRVNAYFTGFGESRRIVLYDTLLTDYTPDQVDVVLAHEMGHWYYRHMLLAVVGMGVVGWIGLFGLQWLLNRTWRPLGLSGPSDVAGLPYLMAVVAIATILSLPFQNGLARLAERQADHFSLVVSQRPETFIELFEKFAAQNLSVVNVPAWEKLLFYTHPPIVERVDMADRFRER